MVISPVQQNELVDIGAAQTPLRLAINTAQYGRTFQDRSHVFKLKKRPVGKISDTDTIFNLNVRGKRGNIVQTYPAVEYDFIPNRLRMRENEFVHVQWTGMIVNLNATLPQMKFALNFGFPPVATHVKKHPTTLCYVLITFSKLLPRVFLWTRDQDHLWRNQL